MSLEPVVTLTGHSDRVWCVKWNSQGTQLASCGADHSIRIWAKEGDTWRCFSVLTEGHQRTVRAVSWLFDGSLLASSGFDATTCIWSKIQDAQDDNAPNWDCDINLEGHENEVKCVDWSPSGRFLSTCSRDKTVWIWERLVGDDFECASVLNDHSQDVKKVKWHPIIDILASCSYDNSIKLYHEDRIKDDWTCFASLDSHESTVWSIAFNKDGSRLASCSDDKTIKIWSTTASDATSMESMIKSSWKLITTLSGYHSRPIFDISWNWTNECIATGDGSNTICVFSPDLTCDRLDAALPSIAYKLAARIEKAHDSDVNSVDWNQSNPSLLASCGDDETVKLWSFSSEIP